MSFKKWQFGAVIFSRASLREDYLIRFKGTFSALVLQKTSAPLAACFSTSDVHYAFTVIFKSCL
jgi:hypothetical protein